MKVKQSLWLLLCLGLAAAVMLGPALRTRFERLMPAAAKSAPPILHRSIPVAITFARQGDMDVIITALGTVTARETVTVHSRVDGELTRIHFHEGQLVKAGDLIAELDRRPFQIALAQATGQWLRDKALLENSKLDLARYRELLAKDSIAGQQVDVQASLVHQYEGAVMVDRAQVDNAKLQLVYARITAPIAGRLGLRQIDLGNIMHANDSQGLVVITNTQPTTAVFSVPSEKLPVLVARLNAGASLTVAAFDRGGSNQLAVGRLLSLDNQIDTSTATLKLKAEFENADNMLFPNQFVNIELRVDTRKDVTLIPNAAVQHGQNGTFVYVVNDSHTATQRAVTLGPANADTVVIERGLASGDQIVIDGIDKLRDGSKIRSVGADRGAGGADGGKRTLPDRARSTSAP